MKTMLLIVAASLASTCSATPIDNASRRTPLTTTTTTTTTSAATAPSMVPNTAVSATVKQPNVKSDLLGRPLIGGIGIGGGGLGVGIGGGIALGGVIQSFVLSFEMC